MSCIPGHACSCKPMKLKPEMGTMLVKLTCSCGYTCAARGGEAVVAHLHDHQAHAGCPRVV